MRWAAQMIKRLLGRDPTSTIIRRDLADIEARARLEAANDRERARLWRLEQEVAQMRRVARDQHD